jgi:hypothetical protein
MVWFMALQAMFAPFALIRSTSTRAQIIYSGMLASKLIFMISMDLYSGM